MPKVAILAGGFGKRLRPLTEETPKPMVKVAGYPIILWQIMLFKSYGYRDFVILAGYRWEKIVEGLGSGRKLGVRIAYVVEDEPLGTGGAIKNAEHVLKGEEYFIVTNGDIITNINLRPLVERVLSSDAVGGIALVNLRSPYGVVEVDEGGFVREFKEKPVLDYKINAGIYVFKQQIFSYLPPKGDIEKTAFPRLASERKLVGVTYNEVYWRSIDTLKDLEEASEYLSKAEWARRLVESAGASRETSS